MRRLGDQTPVDFASVIVSRFRLAQICYGDARGLLGPMRNAFCLFRKVDVFGLTIVYGSRTNVYNDADDQLAFCYHRTDAH